MGGLRLLLGFQLLEEPPFPGTVKGPEFPPFGFCRHSARRQVFFLAILIVLLLSAYRSDHHFGEIEKSI
jgi:hypothetical protein